MNSKAKQTKDSRIEEILDLIMQLASGNLEARGTPSGLSDELDAIITGLNMLAEEFSTQHIALTEAEQRLDEILNVIMAISSLDYTKRAPVSDEGNIFDAIASGLNMLGEELLASTVSKDYVDNILRSMNDTLIVVSPDGNILTVNNATCTILGYKEEELVGQPVGKIFAEEQLFKGARFEKLIKDGSVRNYDMIYRTKSGEQIPVSFSGSVMRDKDGNLTGIVGIARDMREIRELISQLEDKTRSLERANRELKEATVQLIQSEKLSALGELTAGVAHELNQPLNAIKIICQSTLRDIEKNRFEEDALEQDLNDVVNQVNKMAEIIDHMRIFTRRTEGIPKEMIDVNSVIEGALKFVGQQLKNRNIEVVRELSPDLPKVIGDAIRLEQVVMNLITNARNAVEISGKEHKSIEIRTYSENRNQIDNQLSAIDNPAVVVEVTDNGVGIPEDLREKIFQPFFTTREPGKGTGLGLSVASKIVEEHNGRIEVESQVGEGTTFRVLLPMHV
jgi:PAS domain S-box-containing protein